jgi:hypothetical protein
MTSVRPLPSVDFVQILQSVEDVTDDSSIKSNNCTTNSAADDLTFADEKFADDDAVMQCLYPQLTLMTFFGSYFSRKPAAVGDDKSKPNNSCSAKSQRAYCITVLLLLWLNAIRCMTMFTTEQFGSQFLVKLVWMAITLLCAILHTSYFIACESGTLDRVIRETRMSPVNVLYFRKFLPEKR